MNKFTYGLITCSLGFFLQNPHALAQSAVTSVNEPEIDQAIKIINERNLLAPEQKHQSYDQPLSNRCLQDITHKDLDGTLILGGPEIQPM